MASAAAGQAEESRTAFDRWLASGKGSEEIREGDCVIADLRCEAVGIDVLAAWMARELGPEFRIVQSADPDFPFLVSLSLRRPGTRPKSRERRGGPG